MMMQLRGFGKRFYKDNICMKFLCAIHVGCVFAMKCSIEQWCTSVILAGSMLIRRYYPALTSFNVPFNKYTIACFITIAHEDQQLTNVEQLI